MAAVIRESTLLNALVELFEVYWNRAVPIDARESGPGIGPETHGDPSVEYRKLAQLLTSGLTDSAIARQLGLSTRTMRRRTRELFDELQATNRFQAGLQAARRGWL